VADFYKTNELSVYFKGEILHCGVNYCWVPKRNSATWSYLFYRSTDILRAVSWKVVVNNHLGRTQNEGYVHPQSYIKI